MASGTLRYWAAAKAAAGTAEEPYDAGTLAEALAEARRRHADRPDFPRVLARCTFLVDGEQVGTRDPATVWLPEGATVEVLPPFAGGAPDTPHGGPGTHGAAAGEAAQETAGEATVSDAPAAVAASHRTGSPLITPGWQPAALTTALAALLAAAALGGVPALLPAVVLLQAVTAAGWFRLNGMWPARQGIALAWAGGVAADVALLVAPADRVPQALLGALGCWFLLVIVLQLRHYGSADERLDSLTATAAATVLTVLPAGFLAAGEIATTAVAVPVAGAAVATLACAAVGQPRPLLPFLGMLGPAVALLVAAGAGAAAGSMVGTQEAGVLLGLAGGGCALLGLRVASYDYPSRFVHLTAGVALPLAVTAPVAYLLARAVL